MANTERFEKVDINKLVPYARNARTHNKEQIAQLRASLREFGFVSPVIIDSDYNIIAGHGRVAAAKEEGYETVPCVFAENLTEAQKRAYRRLTCGGDPMPVTLEEAKTYLHVDSGDEDGLISDLISTAMQMCRDVARADDTVLNENAAITRIAVLYTVAYLYEHREEANHQTLLLTLRALLFGVRKESF